MKKMGKLVIALFLLIGIMGGNVQAIALDRESIYWDDAVNEIVSDIKQMLSHCEYVPGQIIFKTKEGVTEAVQNLILESIDLVMDLDEVKATSSFENTLDGSLPYFCLDYEHGYFAITVPQFLMESTMALLKLNPYVSYVGLNRVKTLGFRDLTNAQAPEGGYCDTGYDVQTTVYAMEAVGVREAWEKGFEGVGDGEVIVAVLDTGYTPHEDIECVPNSLVYSAFDQSFSYSSTRDYDGHGTFIVGQIGASLNSSGMNGIAKNITIVPIKITTTNFITDPSTGETVSYDSYNINAINAAIRYAEDIGASIISMSHGLDWQDVEKLNDVFTGLFVAGAGNKDDDMFYDADVYGMRNSKSNWIVVGATDAEDERARWTHIDDDGNLVVAGSNFSEIYVDLFAPGTAIRSIANDGMNVRYGNGTSFAVPFVSASAAIIMSHATQYRNDPEGIIELLCNTVDTLSWAEDKCVSGGRLSLINAVEYLYNEPRPRTYPGAHSKGDINGDNYITEDDAVMIREYILGVKTFSYAQERAADIDGNGVINLLDYAKVQKFSNRTYYFPPSY